MPKTRKALPAWSLPAGALVFMLATVAIAFAMPKEKVLGWLIRFVTFHGASTWVNMMLFSVGGVMALAFLLSGRDGIFRWESGVRYVAIPLWLANTGLGMLSSKLAWGGINWIEPRLRATFWILLAGGIVLGIDFLFERPKITALADLALAGGFWLLLLSAPNLLHPDNPVLKSGWEIKGPFFGMVACWTVAMALWIAYAHLRLETAASQGREA